MNKKKRRTIHVFLKQKAPDCLALLKLNIEKFC